MVEQMPKTLLSQVRQLVTVDLDSMDPEVAIRHTSVSESFCDMTSNQGIAYFEATRPERLDTVKTAIDSVKSGDINRDRDAFLQDATVLLAKEVYPYITGNVHAQTSPSTANDTELTIKHAKRLVSLFEANGIPKHRVCIKIPATPESIVACRQLSKMGIQTLATCLFSVGQAIAASQAGCLYVAPYFNELRVHLESGIWKEYADTRNDHPMCPVILTILSVFKKLGSHTKVMPASIVTANEVIALVALEPDHLTLSPSVLDKLAGLPPVSPNVLTPKMAVDVGSFQGVDYLADAAQLLRSTIAGDAEVSRKVVDALRIFDERERMLKEFIVSLYD